MFSAPCIAVDEKYHCEVLLDAKEAPKDDFCAFPQIPHPGVFVKSAVLKQERFDTSYQIAADLKLLLKLYYRMQKKFLFADFPVTYFSLGGVSNKKEKYAEIENRRIVRELALTDYVSFSSQHKMSIKVKSFIRNVLDRAHILGLFLCTVKNWKKHKCAWEHCRWCKRS